jgi:hypothetical protein
MTMQRRNLLLGTALVPLCMPVHAQPMPMRRARRLDRLWVFDLSLTEKSAASDGTMSVVAEADAGTETVGLAIDIGPDWKVVDPRMHVLRHTGEVRLRSLGPRSDALVGFLAKAHRLAAATEAMVAERRLTMTSYFPPGADTVLDASVHLDGAHWAWMRIDWPHRHFSIGASDAKRLLDLLTLTA